MQELSGEFYRIGRLLMRERKLFSTRVVEMAKQFISDPQIMATIRDPRARECTGICYAALHVAQQMIVGAPIPDEAAVTAAFTSHGKTNADEIEKDIFRLRWFGDCVTLLTGSVEKEAKHFIQVRRGGILPDGSVNIIKGNQAQIMHDGHGRLLILVAPSELFAAYLREQSRKHDTVPINIRNIRQELSREPYWIHPPAGRPGVHRFTVDGFRPQAWWVMDYESSGDLREIVSTIYERYLYELDMELDADGNVAYREESGS